MSLNNLANYADLLQRKDASFEVVATRLGFDYDVAYPRITFEAIGWLSPEQLALVLGPDGNGGVCADPLIERMLGATPVADPDEEAEPAPAPKSTPKKRAAATPEPPPEQPGEEESEETEVEEGEADDLGNTPPPPPPPPPAAAPKNPFAAATAKAAPAAPKRGRPRASGATNGAAAQPQPAPSNMESAIHNLLDA
jgi:hypothetical protein